MKRVLLHFLRFLDSSPLWILLLLLLAGSCIKRPDTVLSPKQLEDLLVDVHMAEGLMESDPASYSQIRTRERMMKTVLHKHGVTGIVFDSTLGWYGRNLDQYVKVYDKVITRIRKQDEILRKEIDKERLQTLTLPGDTVDIWKQERSFLLTSGNHSNLMRFHVEVDENFQKEDRFLLRMRMRMMPGTLTVAPRITLGVEQTDREVLSVSQDVVNDGWIELPLNTSSEVYFRNVFGNLYLPPRQLRENQTIYVDSIQLIRMHAPAVE